MTTRRRAGGAALALVAFATWYAWPPAGPNVILVTVDALRADALSSVGGAVQTPNLDQLAADGVLFDHTIADVPWTTPSLATILTGTDASRHRVRIPEQTLAESTETMARRLHDAGWATAAIVGAYPAGHTTNLSVGFDFYEDRYNAPMEYPKVRPPRFPSVHFDDLDVARGYHQRKVSADSFRTDEAVTNSAMAWLARQGDARFLLWVHYFGAHEKRDLRSRPGDQLADMLQRYPEDIARVDHEIGRLLDAIDDRGRADDTLVVVLGDHGQSLLEHKYFGHGVDLYEPSLRVPWIMRFPRRIDPGRRIATPVRTVDVLPTICALIGIDAPRSAMGRNVLAPATSAAADIYAETYLSATAPLSTTVPYEGQSVRLGYVRHALRDGQWKYIRSDPSALLDTKAPPPVPDAVRTQFAREELYDLAGDPGETLNVLDQHPEVAQALRARLAAHTDAGS